MEGHEGPWRGHRWRRPPSGGGDPGKDDGPPAPAQPTTWLPAAETKPVDDPDPDGTDVRGPAALQDDLPPARWAVPERHLERSLVVFGAAYVLLFFDVMYAGLATWLDARFLTALVDLPDSLRAVLGVTFSLPGETLVLAGVVVAVVGRLWVKGSPRGALLVLSSGAALFLFIQFTKWVVGRPRPTTFFAGTSWVPDWLFSTSMAFPSGHSAGAVFVYGIALIAWFGPGSTRHSLLAVGALYPRRLVLAAVALAFLPGVGRVLWGVHWMSDVAAGWLLGMAWLAATLLAGIMWRPGEPLPPELEESGEVEQVQEGLGGLYDT